METRFIDFFRQAARTVTTSPSNKLLYLWVGKPTKTNPKAIAGHDVAGPIEMAKRLANQDPQLSTSARIQFYCLSEYANFYRQQFKDMGVDITVSTIEGLIEQEEITGEFKAETNYVKKHFSALMSDMTSIKSRVAFKDLFSTYLLLTQAGYFLDTNIFPQKDSPINLNGEKATGAVRSPDWVFNDFYFMYSPRRGDAVAQNILKNWLKESTIDIENLSVFENTGLIFMDIKSNGLKKSSYKSYYGKDTAEGCGLFYWRDLDEDALKEKLSYGDIDQQFSSLSSMKFIEECWLAYLDISGKNVPDEKDLLAALPDDVNQAYFFVKDYGQEGRKRVLPKIFYVNKEKNMAVCVLASQSHNGIDVPSYFGELKTANNADLVKLFSLFICNGVTLDSLPAPRYICNVDGNTLLHHAISQGEFKKAMCIIDAGANLALKARFQLIPSKEIFEFTALELSQYLKQDEFVKLLIERIEKREVNEKVVKTEIIVEPPSKKTQVYINEATKKGIVKNSNEAYHLIREKFCEYSGAKLGVLSGLLQVVSDRHHIDTVKALLAKYPSFNQANLGQFFNELKDKLEVVNRSGQMYAMIMLAEHLTDFKSQDVFKNATLQVFKK